MMKKSTSSEKVVIESTIGGESEIIMIETTMGEEEKKETTEGMKYEQDVQYHLSQLMKIKRTEKSQSKQVKTKKRNKWTEDESEKFYEGLDLHGKNWSKISEHIGTKDK